MRVLSVDLGTSNTVAVLSAHGRRPWVVEVDGSPTMPSAVFAGEDGRLIVGRDAERRARLDPARFEANPKRRVDEGTLLLGDAVVPVTEAFAAVLRRVGEEISRQLGGARPDEVRLTHPAQWGPVRRNVLLSAARQAGLGSNLVLIPEPVAAAAHFASFPGHALAAGQALTVYDLGAGTFDVAVVGATQNGFTVLAEDGLPDLGGTDVDQALLEHVGRQISNRDPARWQRLLRPESTGDRRAQRALREDVKAAKESLSRQPQTEVPMPEPFEDVLVTRTELEALIRPSLLRSVDLLASTVRSTGTTPQDLAGIYLVGGSSRIPLVATLLAEQLRVVPIALDQPETAVALGAHHVGADGTTMRTQSIGGQPASGPNPAVGAVGPVGGVGGPAASPAVTGTHQVPAQQIGQQIGQQPVAPQQVPPSVGQPAGQHTGGHPMPGQAPPSAGPAPLPSAFPTSLAGSSFAPPTTDQASKSSAGKKKPLLIGAAALVVVLIAAGVYFFVLKKPNTAPTASGNGNSPSASSSQTNSSDCSGTQQDTQGFTPCMRKLAGNVPNVASCHSGMDEGLTSLPVLNGVIATCDLIDEPTDSVIYVQGSGLTGVTQYVSRASPTGLLKGKWAGNGLKGDYTCATYGDTGYVVFDVANEQVYGLFVNKDSVEAIDNSSLQSTFLNKIAPKK